MKFKLGLTLAFLLTIPGVYAIIAWSISDARNQSGSFAGMLKTYESAFPDFGLQLKGIIWFLIALCVMSIVIILNINPGTSSMNKSLRIFVGCIALLTGAVLGFALM